MKKGLLSIVSLLCIFSGSLFAATSYFRTPLSLVQSRWGTVHYPLPPIDCDCWQIDTMGAYYQRNACEAFGYDPSCLDADACNSSCDNNDHVTTKTVPLSQLWFGKSSFCADEMFAGGQIVGPAENPFLVFSRINPDFDYNERGVVLALNGYRFLGCDNSWFVGGRIALPIKVIEVNQRRSCGVEEIKDTFGDAIVTMQQQLYGPGPEDDGGPAGAVDSRTVRAYRLDLLSVLQLPDGTPMVQYGTAGTNTRIAGQDITINTEQNIGGGTGLRAPMYAYRQNSGVVPLPSQGLMAFEIGGQPPQEQGLMIAQDAGNPPGTASNGLLNAAGSNGVNGDFLAFGGLPNPVHPTSQVNYAGGLGADRDAQAQLFIVPVGASSNAATFEPIGLVVQNTIDYVLERLFLEDETALDFFAERGIDFCTSDCSTGAGDTFIEIYGGKWCECWFVDGLLGFRLPTGTNYDDPKRIYEQTTGNNGHFATKLGVEGGYQPCDWLGIKGDFFWRHNFRATEKRAAAFRGATVRNIGPCIDAQVQWDDFQAHADFTFFSPKCPTLGWDFGYEFYAKTKDDVCFCRSTAVDFIGNTQQLDPCLLENDTNTQSHKVRGEIFNQWGCFQVFLGGSYIIAGKNVMKETEWHIGMKAYF